MQTSRPGRPFPSAKCSLSQPAHKPRRSADTPPDHLLCLDIETVPDTLRLPDAFPADCFPKPAFHRVACVSYTVAKIELVSGDTEQYSITDCGTIGDLDWSEDQILRGFWSFFGSGLFRIVGWNTRCFDLPVLIARSLIHGTSASALMQRGSRWDSYLRRYSPKWHSDLMDLISAHGAAPRHGLDEMARALGLPGKGADCGALVADLVAQGELARVRRYCESDTMNVFAIYLRWALVTGSSTIDGYQSSVRSLSRYLDGQRATRPHLAAFLPLDGNDPAPVP